MDFSASGYQPTAQQQQQYQAQLQQQQQQQQPYLNQQYQQYAAVQQQYQQQMQQYTAQQQQYTAQQQYPQAAGSHALHGQMSTSANGLLQPGRPKGVGGRKGKKVKDPNRPKRPTSAYFFFIASKREEARMKGQHISKVAEWTKQVSALWREMSPPERVVFEQQAVADKKRYEQQMQAYSGKRPKDENKPKRPQSAYFLFLHDFRSKNKSKFTGEGSHKELIRAAGEAWNNLQAVEKIPYEGLAEKEKRKYEEAMKIYNQPSLRRRRRARCQRGGMLKKAKVEAAPVPVPNNGATAAGGSSAPREEEDEDEEEEEDDDEDGE